jgi:hypothetical protein
MQSHQTPGCKAAHSSKAACAHLLMSNLACRGRATLHVFRSADVLLQFHTYCASVNAALLPLHIHCSCICLAFEITTLLLVLQCWQPIGFPKPTALLYTRALLCHGADQPLFEPSLGDRRQMGSSS